MFWQAGIVTFRMGKLKHHGIEKNFDDSELFEKKSMNNKISLIIYRELYAIYTILVR